MPPSYKGGLVVRLKYSDTSASKTSLKVYFSAKTNSVDSTILAHKYFDAKDSSGFLVGTLDFGNGRPAFAKNNSANNINLFDNEIAITSPPKFYELTKTNSTNSMTFSTNPSVSIPRDFAQKVLDYACAISDTFYHYTFRYSARDAKTFWIYIENDPNAPNYGYYNKAFPWTINSGYINIEYSKIRTSSDPDAELKALVAHEFFHFVHNCYDLFDNATWWYQDALCAYVEEKLQANPKNYYSEQIATFYNRPFLGMEAGKEWYDPSDKLVSYQRHGYGMGGVIKELFYNAQQSLSYPWALYQLVYQVVGQNLTPVEVLMMIFVDFKVVWKNYFDKFFTGNLGFIKAGTIREESTLDPGRVRVWNVESATDTIKNYYEKMPDLSANVYRVHLKRDFTDKEKFYLVASTSQDKNDIEVRIYKYKNANASPAPELIAYSVASNEGKHEISIAGLDEIKKTCTSLLVVITNSHAEKPFTGTGNVNVTMKFIKESELSKILKATKFITVNITGKQTHAPIAFEIYAIGVVRIPIKWSGLKFSHDASSSYYIEGEYVDGTVSGNLQTVQVLAGNKDKSTPGLVIATDISCQNIPFDKVYDATAGSEDVEYYIGGSNLTNANYSTYLSSLSYVQDYGYKTNYYVSTDWDDDAQVRSAISVEFTAK